MYILHLACTYRRSDTVLLVYANVIYYCTCRCSFM